MVLAVKRARIIRVRKEVVGGTRRFDGYEHEAPFALDLAYNSGDEGRNRRGRNIEGAEKTRI